MNYILKQIGLILEELYEIFPNCCSFYNNCLIDDLIDLDNIKNLPVSIVEKQKLDNISDENIKSCGIDYNKLLLYFIIAFQEYVEKKENENNDLKNKVNDLESKYLLSENKINDLESRLLLLESQIMNK